MVWSDSGLEGLLHVCSCSHLTCLMLSLRCLTQGCLKAFGKSSLLKAKSRSSFLNYHPGLTNLDIQSKPHDIVLLSKIMFQGWIYLCLHKCQCGSSDFTFALFSIDHIRLDSQHQTNARMLVLKYTDQSVLIITSNKEAVLSPVSIFCLVAQFVSRMQNGSQPRKDPIRFWC